MVLSVGKKALLVIGLVLLADQASKLWIKTNMVLGQEFRVLGNWFIIHFTENPGMAFGIEFWGDNGKLLLSLFRLVAIGLLIFYVHWQIKKRLPTGVIIGFSLILAGAIGNMIDSAIYGVIFNESYYEPARFFPPDGGYSSFLHGRVVDMLYFPVIDTAWPSWVPFVGGNSFVFFRPVFNIADSAITTGVAYLLIFQRNVVFDESKMDAKSSEA
jgi:signal peptidase II